jgi:phosphopantetheinyl transferase
MDFIAGRLLLRQTLRAKTGQADWVIEIDDLGRPLIQTGSLDHQLHCSISHCPGLAVIALSTFGDVGVDAEVLDRTTATATSIATAYFQAHEAAAISAAPDGGRGRLFLHYWTRKEAVTKAMGVGLRLDLAEFSVDPNSPRVRFDRRGVLGTDHIVADAWDLPEHVIACVARLHSAVAPAFDVREAGCGPLKVAAPPVASVVRRAP